MYQTRFDEPEGEGVIVNIEHHAGRFWGIPLLGRLLADSYERAGRRILELLKAEAHDGPGQLA